MEIVFSCQNAKPDKQAWAQFVQMLKIHSMWRNEKEMVRPAQFRAVLDHLAIFLVRAHATRHTSACMRDLQSRRGQTCPYKKKREWNNDNATQGLEAEAPLESLGDIKRARTAREKSNCNAAHSATKRGSSHVGGTEKQRCLSQRDRSSLATWVTGRRMLALAVVVSSTCLLCAVWVKARR